MQGQGGGLGGVGAGMDVGTVLTRTMGFIAGLAGCQIIVDYFPPVEDDVIMNVMS